MHHSGMAMNDDWRARVDAAVGSTMDDLVRLWRADAEALGRLLEERMADGSATAGEVEALVAHRNLRQLT